MSRRLRWLIILAGFCAACATASQPLQKFGHCTTNAIEAAAVGEEQEARTDLASGDYAALLDTLAVRIGFDEAACAVDLVIDELTHQRMASSDQTVAVMLKRAQAWRGAHP